MLYLQKGNFQKIVRWIAGSWMSPNMASLLGTVFIACVATAFYLGYSTQRYRFALLLVPVFLILRMMMNALDGMLAREYNKGTVAGEIANEALDIIGDTVCYGVLYFTPDGPRLSIVILLLLSWAAEFFGVLGKGMPGGARRHETLLGGKPDRAVWMGLLALLSFFFPPMEQYMDVYLYGLSVLVFLTCLLRIRKTIDLAKGKTYESYTWIGR